MKVRGDHFETIWLHRENPAVIQIIDQRFLPFEFLIEDLCTAEDMFVAIRDMHLRGAPLIGAAGALGMYLAVLDHIGEVVKPEYIAERAVWLKSSRPTAVNLAWAIDRVVEALSGFSHKPEMVDISRQVSEQIIDEERTNCLRIGQYGVEIIKELSIQKKGAPVTILTHCNAGWLACIDYGTATAPIYLAHDSGIKVHVLVDETRPRNQGAKLTAWELQQHGVPFSIIADNTGGYMMQQGMVDMVIVGSDRASVYGDIVNKVGTYLKALAANDNNVPFYAALPSSTIDWDLDNGASNTPIEQRHGDELRIVDGMIDGKRAEMIIMDKDAPVVNYAFDITPARLVTGIITERGIAKANKDSILTFFPEKN